MSPTPDPPYSEIGLGRPDSGSFRDPTSRVYVANGTVWRGLSTSALADYRTLAEKTFFSEALARGAVVPTNLHESSSAVAGPWAGVLQHEYVDLWSYPYEWSFEMLKDAAKLQLELTRAAVAEGMITKDASSYNVQFIGTRPVFIDVGSFETLRMGEPWAGYRQFCELFLYPLYLQSILNLPFQTLLRGSIDGISPQAMSSMLGSRGRLNKGTFTHVRLHARLERRYADKHEIVKSELKRAGFGAEVISSQLSGLISSVSALRWDQAHSTWSDYGDRSHYSEQDLELKTSFVRRSVEACQKKDLVLDLGANDGLYSRVALSGGAQRVVAVDSDVLVIDKLYRALKDEGEQRILPLVLNVGDPSPALGWRLRERASFVERVRPDLTLCLAVVHHLALTNNVPLPEIVEMLGEFGAPLVVEFPDRSDPMVKRLLVRKRAGLFDGYNRLEWERALQRRFVIRDQVDLPSGARTLYFCDLL